MIRKFIVTSLMVWGDFMKRFFRRIILLLRLGIITPVYFFLVTLNILFLSIVDFVSGTNIVVVCIKARECLAFEFDNIHYEFNVLWNKP